MEYKRYNGTVTIRVRFRTRVEYEKFRKYVLNTDWSYCLEYPMWEELKMDFHDLNDIQKIDKQIINLLQLGFEVCTCRYKLEEFDELEDKFKEPETVEEEIEEKIELNFDIGEICNDIWKKLKGV